MIRGGRCLGAVSFFLFLSGGHVRAEVFETEAEESVSEAEAIESPEALNLRAEILRESDSLRGKPYVWNAIGPNTFDCSGFIFFVLGKVLGTGRFNVGHINAVDYKNLLQAEGAGENCDKARPADIVYFPQELPRTRFHHIGIISDPGQKIFITAQDKRMGVAYGSFAPNAYWGSHHAECFTNIWVNR